MIINKYGPSSKYPVLVPDYASGEKNLVWKDKPGESSTFQTCEPFDLPEDKWFALDIDKIIRFPKDKEWTWRTQRAVSLIKDLNNVSDPYGKLTHLENAAYLCGFSLTQLVDRLKEHASPHEDLTDTFARIMKSDPLFRRT